MSTQTPSPRKTLTAADAAKLRRQRMQTARELLPGWRSLQGCGRRLIDRKQGVTVVANRHPPRGEHQSGL